MEIIVTAEAETRLDRYLRRLYPSMTQGIVEKSLRNGDITLNGKKSKSSDRVLNRDVIQISAGINIETTNRVQKSFSANIVKLASKILGSYLVFQNEDFIAIDKPAGLATQSGTKVAICVDDALRYLNQNKEGNFKLVHRLDKETSGILLIAKNHSAATKLTTAFEKKLINKTYIAITTNIPNSPQGEISSIIGKDRGGVFEVVKQSEDGKYALTNYKVVKHFTRNQALVEFEPVTGRMHQIRFHAKQIDCPIVGDCKYGHAPKGSRLMLHAYKIMLSKEIFGRLIKIESELPEEFIISHR